MPNVEFALHPKQLEAFWTPANEILFGGSAGGGKALPLNTPIPTPCGYKFMGDLKVGDLVFDMHGVICQITDLSDILYNPNLWEFTFDDGSKITSCEDHQWVTYNSKELAQLTRRTEERRKRRREIRVSRGTGRRPDLAIRNSLNPTKPLDPPSLKVRTTKEIIETLRTSRWRANYAIPCHSGLQLKTKSTLPIHPYLLGLWLGDGNKESPVITSADPEVIEYVRSLGYSVGSGQQYKYRVYDTVKIFRELGVLNNKHIPQMYLRSSASDRLELLKGLLDSDGNVGGNGGVEFCNTNKNIIDGILEIIHSFGWKACAKERRATLYGKDCGAKWVIKFTPDQEVFRLKRKAEKQKIASRRTTKFKYIISAQSIQSVPARCIMVNSPTHTYLAGKEMIVTHNSFIARVASIMYSMAIPGLQSYFFRRQYADLVTNHLEGPNGFRALLQPLIKNKTVRIVSDEKIVFVNNNSVIFLCHCQHEKDLDAKYRGPEMHFLVIEEATQFTEKMIRFLRTRCRMVGVTVPPEYEGMFPRILYTTNPGGPSHSYFYRNFVIPCEGTVIKQPPEEGGMRRLFIRSKLDDNPSMLKDDPEYENRLSGLGPPQLVRALRDGDWTAVEGAFFPELNESHKLTPFNIPAHWLRFRAFDWGNKSPFAVQWWAVSPGEYVSQRDHKGEEFGKYIPRGAIVLYREWYGRDRLSRVIELDNDRIASGIIDRSGGEVYAFSVADASIFSQFGGPSIAEQFAKAGVVFKASSKNRKGGLSEVRRRLVGADGMPMLYAFQDCHWWWETVPTIQVDDNDPEDCDTDGEDHHVDATYYACMARPYVTDKDVEQKLTYTGLDDISIRDYLNLAKLKQ